MCVLLETFTKLAQQAVKGVRKLRGQLHAPRRGDDYCPAPLCTLKLATGIYIYMYTRRFFTILAFYDDWLSTST